VAERRRYRGAGRPPGARWAGPSTASSAAAPAADADADPESVARGICLRLLTGAPKTRHQLAAALARRGVAAEVATAVLDRFTDVGLIDDAAFARAWIGTRQRGRGLARRALATELHHRGVDAEVARAALEVVDSADEEAAGRALLRRRAAAYAHLDRPVAARRLAGMLARRGYPGALAARLVTEQLNEAVELDDGA